MVFTVPADRDEESAVAAPAKVDTKPVLDKMGFPALPTTHRNDDNLTKVVQSMVREYCAAHMRQLHFMYLYRSLIR